LRIALTSSAPPRDLATGLPTMVDGPDASEVCDAKDVFDDDTAVPVVFAGGFSGYGCCCCCGGGGRDCDCERWGSRSES